MLAEPVATKLSCLEVRACCGCFEKEILQIWPWGDAQQLHVSVHGSYVNTFTKIEETYLEESHFNGHDGVFRKKKKGYKEKGRTTEEFPFAGYPMIFFWMADWKLNF